MRKQIGLTVLGGALFLYVTLVIDELFGQYSSISIMLLILFAGVALQKWWMRKASIAINKIAEDDSRCIRFDGNKVQAQKAANIAASLQWQVEQIETNNPIKSSVRLRPTDGSSTAKVLLKALFDAGLAGAVIP